MANSEKSDSGKYRFYFIFAIASGLVFAVLQTLLYRFYYENEIMLYKADAVLVTVFGAALALCVVVLLSALISVKDSFPETKLETGKFTDTSAMFCGFVFVIYVAMSAFSIIQKDGMPLVRTALPLFKIALPILAFIGCIYFFMTAFHAGKEKNIVSLFGIFVVILLALSLLNLYFDKTTPINDPVKVMRQLSIISAIFYFLGEMHIRLGTGSLRQYTVYSGFALIFIPVSCISMFASVFTGKFPLTPYVLISSFFDLSLYIYIISRSITLIKSNANN